MTAGEAITDAAGLARRRDGLLSLRRRRAPPPGRRRLAAPAAARAAGDAAQADHDDRSDQRRAPTPTRKKWRGWSRPTTCSRFRSSTKRTSWSASSPSTTSSTSSRTRRPKTSTAWPASPATSACSRPPGESLRKRLPWLLVNLVDRVPRGVGRRAVRGHDQRRGRRSRCSCRSSPGMGGNAATQTLTVIVRGIALGELTWANSRKALFKEAAGRPRQRHRLRRGRRRWSSGCWQGRSVARRCSCAPR